MNLIWKLLRQHISIAQFVGFFFANLLGMFIILFGFQFYHDVLPVFTQDDSFLKGNYLIVSKKIGTGTTLSGRANTFNKSEISDLQEQTFVNKAGTFTSTDYKVEASMGINGVNILNTELFLESIPDAFVDISADQWRYKQGSDVVPIILPRSYLTMYNFGFAQSHSLPKISDGLVGLIQFKLFVNGNNQHREFRGQVVGFSNKINSILVPETFMTWSNSTFAPTAENAPTRMIIEVNNATDNTVSQYMETNGYEVENNDANAEKTTYFLRLMVVVVIIVGLVISLLSIYILMLSIYLLVQKNSYKLENLLLIGYSTARVSRPYQWLTIGLNLAVLCIVIVGVGLARGFYMPVLLLLMPDLDTPSMLPTLLSGIALFVVVSMLNAFIIRRKILNIWKRKE